MSNTQLPNAIVREYSARARAARAAQHKPRTIDDEQVLARIARLLDPAQQTSADTRFPTRAA